MRKEIDRQHLSVPAAKKNIFVVEDNRDISDIIEYLLVELGHRISVYATITDLKKIIINLMPDLIIMDILLPDGNGMDLCKDLKSDPLTSQIPIVLMSASEKNKHKSSLCEANDFIDKPFDIDDFTRRVQLQIA